MPTSTLIHEMTLGPLTAAQRTDIMRHATVLTPAARRLFRRLLILTQERGLCFMVCCLRVSAMTSPLLST